MSRGPKDYYAVLHVQPGAPVEIIRASYRTLMQRLKAHPDLGGETGSAAEINEAYAVLKDPAKRAAYDSTLPGRTVPAERAASETQPNRTWVSGLGPRTCAFCGEPQVVRGPAAERCERCGSTLAAVAALEHDERTRRTLHRVAKDEPIEFFTSWRETTGRTGVLVDLSLSGMRFVARDALEREQVIRVECAVFSSVAQIAHCYRRQMLFHIGAQFVTVSFHRQKGSLVSIPV